MRIETVAVLAPGDMGQSRRRRAQGERPARRQLPRRAQRADPGARRRGRRRGLADDAALVRAADVLLSILVPARPRRWPAGSPPPCAPTAADLLYVDCNAIAPATARAVGAVVEAAGARFVDAGIIGPPPRVGAKGTRFYASGTAAADFAQLRDYGLDVRIIGEHAGDASAVKMCYAALTKGTTAIMTELAVAAVRLGVSEPLRAELELSQPEMLARMARSVPAMVPKAHRWVGEMEEIAQTFAAAGLTPLTFEGAAALYAVIAATPLGRVAPEEWARAGRGFEQVIRELATVRRAS